MISFWEQLKLFLAFLIETFSKLVGWGLFIHLYRPDGFWIWLLFGLSITLIVAIIF
jgi:hypothetical protein